jgi:flavin reductase (DIM6/NTAB) family NADH-FMN oxidoreductase RutF/rubredoxin
MDTSKINFEAFFKISYGLYVVTSGNSDKANGFIANAVFQVTASPAQFAVCCNKDNFTAQTIAASGVFAISVLRQEVGPKTLGTFGYRSGRDLNKLENFNVMQGATGVPIVTDDTVAFIECKVMQTVDVGSHLMFIGEVVSADVLSTEPPITYEFYREVKKGLAPKNAPTYIDKSKLVKKTETPVGDKYKCAACGYVYDPAKGDPENSVDPGTQFEDLPEAWVCPLCGTEQGDFVKLEE